MLWLVEQKAIKIPAGEWQPWSLPPFGRGLRKHFLLQTLISDNWFSNFKFILVSAFLFSVSPQFA